jgi:dynein heavy chain 1, cytosolic
MRTTVDDDDDASSGQSQSSKSATQQPAWMRTLYERSREWLEQLPSVLIHVLDFL